MKYRQEIDGLRALAVLPVVFFHADFSVFSGGFVGVDVFFVISGYLITSIILSEKEEGKFSLINFYERRARRILPALFFVMLVSLPLAWFWLLSIDLLRFAESLIAVSFFSSNILFWKRIDYWHPNGDNYPLLHTWSLGIEEQYYILFPIFLMVWWRYGVREGWIVFSFVLIAIVSFIIAQWGVAYYPIPSFYLLPSRGWEIAVGGIIAFYSAYYKSVEPMFLRRKFFGEVFGALGLLLIVYSIFVFDKTTPFPSAYTLVPTIGAALILFFSSSQTMVGRLLGNKVCVGIGLLSYGIYLWHWPLFVFAKNYQLSDSLSDQTYVMLILLTVVLAYFSWRFVERPFRDRNLLSRRFIFVFSFCMIGFFSSIGAVVVVAEKNGGAWRFGGDQKLTSLHQNLGNNYGLNRVCDETKGSVSLLTECQTDEKPEILIWGDSFAMHLVLGVLASNPKAKIIQMTRSSCPPIFDRSVAGTRLQDEKPALECLKFNRSVREWLENNNSVKYVVVASNFSLGILSRNGKTVPATTKLIAEGLQKTLKELERLNVTPIVVYPPPANGKNIARCVVKAQWRRLDLSACDFSVQDMLKDRLDVYQMLDNITDNISVIRLDKMLCEDSVCRTHVDGINLYSDRNHLSREGGRMLGKKHDFYRMIVGKR